MLKKFSNKNSLTGIDWTYVMTNIIQHNLVFPMTRQQLSGMFRGQWSLNIKYLMYLLWILVVNRLLLSNIVEKSKSLCLSDA